MLFSIFTVSKLWLSVPVCSIQWCVWRSRH